jgi:hypothetical protein
VATIRFQSTLESSARRWGRGAHGAFAPHTATSRGRSGARAQTRAEVANAIGFSDEALTDWVDRYYLQFLERPVDPNNAAEIAGVQQIVKELEAGVADELIIADIIGNPSDEFYDRGTR